MKLKEEKEGVFNLTSDIKAESNLMITIPTNILNKVKTDSDLAIVKDLEDKIIPV